MVGFHGSFYADPVTLDVRRVEVVAEDIPAELGVTAAETTVDYGRLRIGDEEFLLPVESELMMAMPDVVEPELDPVFLLPEIHRREHAVVQ